MKYVIKKSSGKIDLSHPFDGGDWKDVEALNSDNFRVESSDHHPVVQCKMQYTDDGIYGLFNVQDRYVRCVAKKFQDSVCVDSCVEFFVEPSGNQGYANFEFSGNGVLLLQHLIDPSRDCHGFKNCHIWTEQEAAGVEIFHTLPAIVDPEITEPITWRLGFFIPFETLKRRFKISDNMKGEHWRANFNKCADATSKPHWCSWSPYTHLNFHMPSCFGDIYFE